MATVSTSWFITLIIILSNSSASCFMLYQNNNNNSEQSVADDKVVAKLGGKTFYVHSYIPKSCRLSTPELIRVVGHEYEEFDVITKDGYILKLFHITGNSDSDDLPILMLHGLMDSSDVFLLRREISLGINLTGSGYDVWLGNNRGNRYSRRHVSLDPDVDKQFWDFTFHENGYYDHTAFIDYVLEKTGKPQVIIVANSQGVMNQIISGATRPEYNQKIKVFFGLAPSCFLRHLGGLAAAAPVVLPPFYTALTAIGEVEFLNQNSMLRRFIQNLCTKDLKFGYALCGRILFGVLGPSPEQFEPKYLLVFMGQYFAGTSVKTIGHGGQLANGHFGWFDYGPIKNFAKYGTFKAPLYNVTKFTSKVVLMVGKTDYGASIEDSKNLRDALPNVVYFEMPRKPFSHMDFLYGNQTYKYFLPYFHELLNRYK